jgi:aryl-alcohol dehydrogenase-like predicted oxidoreductase
MLYDRIIGQGTINEPGGKPEPVFALPSTVNWMRALRTLVAGGKINFATASMFYASQIRRMMDILHENTVLEQLFLSLHHLSALDRLSTIAPVADVARIGILAWYYERNPRGNTRDGNPQHGHEPLRSRR